MLTGILQGTQNTKLVQLDLVTHGIITVEFDFASIHQGNQFEAFHNETALGNNERALITLKTPNTGTLISLSVDIETSKECDYTFYEAPTVTDNTGSALLLFNQNRRLNTASIILDTSQTPDTAGSATLNPDMGSGSVIGTVLHRQRVGDGHKVGGEVHAHQEWILAPDTIYAMALVAREASTIVHMGVHVHEIPYLGRAGG